MRDRLSTPLKRLTSTVFAKLDVIASKSAVHKFCYEFLIFGMKQAWACLFGGLMLALLIGSHLFYPHDAIISRYDFLVVSALIIQIIMLTCKLETIEEAKVIFIFHVVGTVMEIFKTHMGSWIYPEHNILRIGGVPLFSGFMYAAVGSYIARAWKIFHFRFSNYPPLWTTAVLALLIYVNFFTHHYVMDIRLGLFALSILLYFRTFIYYRPHHTYFKMPMLLSFVLVSAFIWFAENIGTFTNAWIYPNQKNGWSLVPIEKLGSWYLLMLISGILVSFVHPPRKPVDLTPVKG